MPLPFRRAAPPPAPRTVSPAVRLDAYPSNAVKTSKYTLLNMLPYAVFEQFRRLSNFYFLIVAAVSFVPNVSPTSPVTTTLPLLVVVGFGLARDVWEDMSRRRDDAAVNARPVVVVRPRGPLAEGARPVTAAPEPADFFARHRSLDPAAHIVLPARALAVGDVALIPRDTPFPADMLLLAAPPAQPVCYISTANLDGESNLKRRPVPDPLRRTAEKRPFPDDMEVVAPPPTDELYEFDGVLRLPSADPAPLRAENLLLRGSILRNTSYVYALVLYNGEDTKLARNMRDPPSKLGGVERMMNRVVVGLFSILAVVTIIVAIIAGVWQSQHGEGQWYMGEEALISGSSVAFRSLGTFLILFHTFVPVSLFVTLEFVRIIQGLFINADVHMRSKGIAVRSKANNLNETLGYVEHIFSDKTGTLTENVMRFVACTAGEKVFDERRKTGSVARAVRNGNVALMNLVRAMALSHDVVPSSAGAAAESIEQTDASSGGDDFQGESPDEVALVLAAFEAGMQLRERRPGSYVLKEEGIDDLQEYMLLGRLEFTSERKRMSTVVRCPDGKVRIFTKGADVVMIDLMESGTEFTAMDRATDSFAKDGLRTLVFGSRVIPEEEYKKWALSYAEANTAIEDRGKKEARVAELIEQNLQYLGVTAVEDKLQENVPGTITFLREAGIRLWVLTGDKRETAENIGYSSQLLDQDMTVHHIDVDSAVELEERLSRILDEADSSADILGAFVAGNRASEEDQRPVRGHHRQTGSTASENLVAALTLQSRKRGSERPMAVIIDGSSLSYAKGEQLEELFLQVATMCKTVICARVTPLQKATVVQMVRKYEHSLTLAIGDGGNDVSMIQEAHIGIGIKGKEGSQAARAADYSMGEFQHLRRLLAVHGRFSYIRTAGVINLSFYKNIFFSTTQICFQFFCFASGTTLHDQWIVTAWNSILTLFPPFLYGIFERDLEERTVLQFPSVYKTNRNNRLFSMRTVLEFTIAYSVWHALVVFFMTYFFFGRLQPIVFQSGKDAGFYLTGLAVSVMAVPTALAKFLISSHLWNAVVLAGSALSFALLWALIPIFVHLAHEFELEGVLPMLFSSPTFHFLWPIVFVTAFIPDFLVLASRVMRKDNLVGQLQMMEAREASKSRFRRGR